MRLLRSFWYQRSARRFPPPPETIEMAGEIVATDIPEDIT
jgi:hypothetical protein